MILFAGVVYAGLNEIDSNSNHSDHRSPAELEFLIEPLASRVSIT